MYCISSTIQFSTVLETNKYSPLGKQQSSMDQDFQVIVLSVPVFVMENCVL